MTEAGRELERIGWGVLDQVALEQEAMEHLLDSLEAVTVDDDYEVIGEDE